MYEGFVMHLLAPCQEGGSPFMMGNSCSVRNMDVNRYYNLWCVRACVFFLCVFVCCMNVKCMHFLWLKAIWLCLRETSPWRVPNCNWWSCQKASTGQRWCGGEVYSQWVWMVTSEMQLFMVLWMCDNSIIHVTKVQHNGLMAETNRPTQA